MGKSLLKISFQYLSKRLVQMNINIFLGLSIPDWIGKSLLRISFQYLSKRLVQMNINIFLSLSITVNRRMYAGKDPSQLSQLAPSCTAYHNHLSMFQLFFMYLNTAMRCKIELLSLTVWGKLPKNDRKYFHEVWTMIFSNVWISSARVQKSDLMRMLILKFGD